MQEYAVQYTINVNSQAAQQAILQFQEATQKMLQLTSRFDHIARSVGKVNAALASIGKNIPKMDINTTAVETKLRNVISLLHQAKTAASQISQGKMQAVMNTPVTTPKNTKTSRNDLRLLQRTIANTNKAIANLNKQAITPKANTANAIKSLDLLLAKINEIKANGKITITASAAGASGAVAGAAAGRRGGGGTTAATGAMIAASRMPAGQSRYLYPTTRQVLGPTYAGTGANVAGEMIKGMGIAYGLSSLMSGIGGVFKDATAYENISQTTKNILGAHDKRSEFESDFRNVNQLMRQVGMETKFTAPQVASAGKFLAMAGYSVGDIQQAIRPIANIALVGDTDLGETADVVTNIMTGYEIPSANMNNAADILTMTFTKSNTTLMSLAESFKYAGTVAHQSGLDFSTAAAAIGVLGDAGIQGSHAGTTLRMMLLNMVNPTKKAQKAWAELGISTKDENGNLRDFNAILADLKAKRDQMEPGKFQTLINSMFRVTAAPGALALIQNSAKVQEVTDLNRYGSYGLSTELADAKKNTIEGLWYQFTSSFTESGMQGFEQMQGVIRDFLQRMIKMMQSADFAAALKSGMETFLKLINAIVDVFGRLMKMWNALPNWVKDAFVWFVKIQMTLGIISSIAKSFLSTWLMIRGVMRGSWLSVIVKPFASALVYMMQLYNIQRSILKLGVMQSLWGTVSGSAVHAGRGVMSWLRAGSTVAGGATAMGSTVAAGASNASAAVAGAVGTTLLGAIQGIASFMLTNPIGWGIMAVSALAYVGYQIYDTWKVTNACIEANKAWGESYRKLGVDKIDFSNQDDTIIGNMRIFNNTLLSQNEKVEQSIDLWNRYWEAKNGPKEDHSKDQTKFSETAAGSQWDYWLNAADQWGGVDAAFRGKMENMGGDIRLTQFLDSNGKAYSTNIFSLFGREIDLKDKNQIGENLAVQLLLAEYGADTNNQQFKDFERFALTSLGGVHNYNDYLRTVQMLRDEHINSLSWNSKWNWISSETAKGMTFADVKESQMYIRGLQHNMLHVLEQWNEFGLILQDADANKVIDPQRIQTWLSTVVGPIFDPTHGMFGSEQWLGYVRDMVENPEKYGFKNTDAVTTMITQAFDNIVNLYQLLDTNYKPLFADFLNRTPFENVLPGNKPLGSGGYYGGTRIGETATFDGKQYTWDVPVPMRADTKEDVAQFGHWVDKDGNVYAPKDAKQTATWTPPNSNSTGGGNGGKNKNWTNDLHNGADQSKYQSHYKDNSAAPKQVIVNIGSLMKIDKQEIDWNNGNQVAVVENIKEQLATALLDVVQDFNANIS